MIFAFQETMHQEDYTAEEYVYPANEWDRMRMDAEAAMEDIKALKKMLQKQRKSALSETVKSYQSLGEL